MIDCNLLNIQNISNFQNIANILESSWKNPMEQLFWGVMLWFPSGLVRDEDLREPKTVRCFHSPQAAANFSWLMNI
jgi:hypothetical protein